MMENTICREAMRKKLEDQKESITVMRRQVESVPSLLYGLQSVKCTAVIRAVNEKIAIFF